MSDRDGHLVLYPTRINIPLEIRRYLITLLNQTLACTVDLRSQVTQASWNVKGQDCSQLQVLFTTMAAELNAYANLMAERIIVLGGVALGTARTAALQSTLLSTRVPTAPKRWSSILTATTGDRVEAGIGSCAHPSRPERQSPSADDLAISAIFV
jgi:DNA-binding ferritin-like protein